MDDFDLDLVDELCCSFSTPCRSQNSRILNSSSIVATRKRTSTTNSITPVVKRVCLTDMTNKSVINECDEIDELDESALQMLCEEWEQPSQFPTLLDRVAGLLEKHRNIRSLHDWQKKCLDLPARRKNQNLIYTLPTSGGKTLVAEIMMLNCLFHRNLDAIFILPFVAVVQEKVRSLQPFADELGFHLEEYAATKGRYPPIKRRLKRSLYICTIEKANSLINSLIENNRTSELGIAVVDELHMIGEGQRGATLECLLTKIRMLTPQPQIVGMSATLANIEDLLKFLGAQFYEECFRPVELDEYVKINDIVYKINRNNPTSDQDQLIIHRNLDFKYTKQHLLNDPDQLVGLVSEVIPDDSCLVFCASKINCENVARLIISFMPAKLLEDNREKRATLLEALIEVNEGDLCETLKATIPYGVAYHHSGLTGDERQLIEEAFLDGILTCITCTSTLSTGVNLPAKRVILRSPYVGSQFLTSAQYKQMSGRAGRTGHSQIGECYVIAHEKDMKQLRGMLFTTAENTTGCDSNLCTNNNHAIKQLLLNAISLKMCSTYDSLVNLLGKTLLALQAERLNVNLESVLDECLQYLIDTKIILVKEKAADDSESSDETKVLVYETTKLGRATVEGSIDLALAESLYSHLTKSLLHMNLENPLHLLYVTMPFDLGNMNIAYRQLVDRVQEMKNEEKIVLQLLSIDETFLQKKAVGLPVQQKVSKETMLRFYVTVMLYDLFKNKNFYDVAKFWEQSRGTIQNLYSQVASYASSILYFSKSYDELWPYHQLLPIFIQRLTFCTSLEILPLMEIPGIKRGRALQLVRAGFRTLRGLAKAQPEDLVKAVVNLPLRTAQILVKHSKRLLVEQAEDLRDQAAELVENIQ